MRHAHETTRPKKLSWWRRAPSAPAEPDQESPPSEEVEHRVDEAVEGSFPASDPPPWTLGPPSWSSSEE